MSFDLTPTKINPSPADIERFASKAKINPPHFPESLSSETTTPTKRTESILFRCSKSVFEDIEFVFQHTNIKSKQKLLESLIIPEVKKMARQIRLQQTADHSIARPHDNLP
ncbi:hypothetical protein ACIQAL_21670 [Pseudomonas sp. NPDC088368]|uniref:hypothetical protein n=1 Tax=Pseudomonas sp. NPDC088368 TaxID=3364453 RepID=UPI0037FFBF14